MAAGALHTWSKRHIAVRWRLGRLCTASLLFLMVATTTHSLNEAARFSRLHPSLVAKWLPAPSHGAITTREQLSKTQARKLAKARERGRGLPWQILLISAATSQHRASLHPAKAPTFNHGKGYVSGHPWPNIVLVLGDLLRPLPPMPCYSQGDCRAPGLT